MFLPKQCFKISLFLQSDFQWKTAMEVLPFKHMEIHNGPSRALQLKNEALF